MLHNGLDKQHRLSSVHVGTSLQGTWCVSVCCLRGLELLMELVGAILALAEDLGRE